MRLPALIIASAGNGYQVLFKSRAFDSLNPRDFEAVCNRMDSFKFESKNAYFITQSLGKMVIGKSTQISKPEFGQRKIKVTHCYFMNMSSFIDIVRGFRRQGAVIATFKEHVRQDYDSSVEDVTFIKKNSVQNELSAKDIVDTIISFGMAEGNKKYMFSDIESEVALKVLFEYFPANYISDLSVLTSGEPETNDMNILFGGMNVISDNRIISVHAAARGIANISDELTLFVVSGFKNSIVEIMEHVDSSKAGFLAELVSVTRIISDFEKSGIISAGSIMKLMDKSQSIEGKMAVYGIIVEMQHKLKDSQISNMDTLEKYWAFALYTSIVGGDKKNAALIHNVCTTHKLMDREAYLEYVRQAIILKERETSDEDLALLILISHEKTFDKTKVINNRYDIMMMKAFIGNRLNLGSRRPVIEDIINAMMFS